MSKNLLLEDVGPGEELPGFDIDNPVLLNEIADKSLKSGGLHMELLLLPHYLGTRFQ